MQFTDISTVTGTANAMGSLNATVPFVGNSGTISPATSLSGGPSFSVANLNTQEFYSGIQTPISKQMIGVFLAQGVRPEVLFPLVISDLTIADGNMTRLVKTDVETPDQFASTYSFILRLVFNGLTVEPTKTASQIGPTLSELEAKAILRDVLRASAEARSGNRVPALTPKKSLPSGYVLNEETSDFRFCFDPIRSTRAKELYPDSNILGVIERTPYPIVLPLAYANNAPIPDLTVEIPLKYVCGHAEDKSASNVDLKFTLRSLEAMYYYLGSLARIELGLTTGEPTPLSYPGENQKPFFLFNIKRGLPAPIDPSVIYGAGSIYVSVDPSGSDASTEVMQILADLQAIESKASNFPAPSTISILAR